MYLILQNKQGTGAPPNWGGSLVQNKVLASDGQASDRFGASVSISSDGNTAIVGAQYEGTNGTDAGAAYVYMRSGGTWIEQQKILASDGQASDFFGYSVSLSSDGNTAIVGAYLEDNAGGTDAGAAYVFTRSGGVWTEQQKLLASDGVASDRFGYSVSISSDGNTAIVGARGEGNAGGAIAGAAYVFTRSGGTWTEQQKLLASDGQTSDQFGYSVSISSDGNTAIVGAQLEDTNGTDAGAAYVFTRSGGVWTEQQKLLASDGQAGDGFGISVSISSDGNTAIVGAAYEDTNGTDAGAAYVFTRSGGTWTEQQKLLASDGQIDDNFGNFVSLNSDGSIIIVGARLEDTNGDNAGAAYVFTQSGSVWSEQRKLLANDGVSTARFSWSVSLNSDGSTAIVGAKGDDNANGTNAGAVYIFDA